MKTIKLIAGIVLLTVLLNPVAVAQKEIGRMARIVVNIGIECRFAQPAKQPDN